MSQTEQQLSQTDPLVANAAAYGGKVRRGTPVGLPPSRGVAVLACMDARLNPYGLLGLQEGEAHVIRNAGGVVDDDAVRSLAISQNLLGTEEIILIHHTDCGMLTFTDEQFAASLEAETGERPHWHAHTFPGLEEDVRAGIEEIEASPFIPRPESVGGFVYEVESGSLREVA